MIVFAALRLLAQQTIAAPGVPQIGGPGPAIPIPIPALPPLSSTDPYHGTKVTEIRLEGASQQPSTLQHLSEVVLQEKGKPLDREKIRQSLRALYATGRFSDIDVEVERISPEEVALVFVGTPNYFVGTLLAAGAPKRMTTGELLDATKLQLGEVITPLKISQAIGRMKSVLADNGYYQAEIHASIERHPSTQLADILFTIVPHELAHIGKITVEGDPGYSVAEIAAIAGLQAGHTVTRDRLNRGLQKLKKRYTKQDRLESQISITDHLYHPETNLVDFTLKIERGPVVNINVEGATLTKGQLKKLVPVYEESAVDDDLLNEGRRNIRDFLQSEGYFDAKVNYTQDLSSDQTHLTVIYDIDRGIKHDLVKVAIDIKPGTSVQSPRAYFSDEDIRERLQVQPQSMILSHGRFSQVLMNEDADNIAALYRSAGFLSVKVQPEPKDNYLDNQANMEVIYHIDEGPQTLVSTLTISGNHAVPTDKLLELLNNTSGQPYSEANVGTDRDAILNYYFDRGFPAVQFDSSITPVADAPNRVNIVYSIREGSQVFVDRVLMSQLHYTKSSVVDRQMQIAGGDPLSQSQMLKTQADLYNLGIFNEVKMAVQNPDGDSKYKDVLVQFQEARRWTFDYGFGLEASTGQPSASGCAELAKQGETTLACSEGKTGVSPRVSFGLSRINFRGRAHTITLQTHIGTLQKEVLATYDAPRWFDKDNWKLTFTGLYDNSINVTTFTSERLEGSVQLEQKHGKVDTFLYRMTYRRVQASNVVVSPDQIPLYSEPVRIGIPSFTYIRDKRDNPIDTKNGNYTTFDTGVASKYFGSSADPGSPPFIGFGRFLIQNSTYHPFDKKKWVFARQTRIGVAEPWGSTIIPLPERFLAGGTNSLRGFALNQAGPRDLVTGAPLGGNALFANTLELRTPPLILPFVDDNLSFAFFHDAGNVFNDGKEMFQSLGRWYQPRREDCFDASKKDLCSFAYMTQTVGAGVRYRTPIGPIRIDLGYNLNPSAYPSTQVDTNGNQVFVPETSRRVNVFFSIGQSF